MNSLNNEDMFYGASPEIFIKAKALRNKMTPAEKILWDRLSKNQMMGFRFRRQHPINNFIADFYCHKARFVVEIDGDVHLAPEQREYDEGRSYELEQFGITVTRYTNEEIFTDLEWVLKSIEEFLKGKVISLTPPRTP